MPILKPALDATMTDFAKALAAAADRALNTEPAGE